MIENVAPQVDGGRFAAKRTVGDAVEVEADVFCDGHDALAAVLLWRAPGSSAWSEVPMVPLVNDRWRASFQAAGQGRYELKILAWVDRLLSWRRDLAKKIQADQEVGMDLLIGARLVEEAAGRAEGTDRAKLAEWARELADERAEREGARRALALSAELLALASRHPDRSLATGLDRVLEVAVERERAGFSSWYELFPRSASPEPGGHGTFADVERLLPYVAGMGFDVLYLPPIHPIGRSFRKGPNNSTSAGPGDVGSPWAIGSAEGGHKSVHPELGTLEDFERLVERARGHGLEVALDIAFQCAPDHPYVSEHPGWFRARPDGTIQYAENPPKRYQDIYPFDFECEDWRGLWKELRSVFAFWIERGVTIFRVDNPHTKPFPFWEWVIADIQREWPDVLFLSEAFTRPKVKYRLAKLGFTWSYTYFAWRNTKWELETYLGELMRPPLSDLVRPHFWPNTPDILTEHLQTGGRAVFASRLVLAATLAANYGIYGPAFELGESRAVAPGREEYLDSEKYQLRTWDLDDPASLRELIARVNRIRRENPALQRDRNLFFHEVDGDQLMAYSKRTDSRDNVILVVVNLDPHHTHAGWTGLDLAEIGVEEGQSFQVHDLLTGARYVWTGARNYLEIDPRAVPAHIFRVRRRVRSEQDFDYFL